jgi:hypothetical protein
MRFTKQQQEQMRQQEKLPYPALLFLCNSGFYTTVVPHLAGREGQRLLIKQKQILERKRFLLQAFEGPG